MAILDRFKSQPPWKHTSPRVRAQAAADVDDEAVIAELARDADAGVRRVAMARLSATTTLSEIMRSEGPAADDARQRLMVLAISARDADAGKAAAAQLLAAKDVAQVAKQAALLPVAEAALAQVTQDDLLASVARHAIHDGVRLSAVARVGQDALLEDTATKTDFKDAGLAAVERLAASPEALGRIAERARNKAVARKAASLIRAMAAQPEAGLSDDLRRHLTGVCQAMESLSGSTDAVDATRRLSQLEQKWAESDEGDAELNARFAAARQRAHDHIAALDAAREAHALAHQAAHEGLAARRRLCDEVEGLSSGEDGVARLAEIQREWASLETVETEVAARLQQRFLTAVRDCEQRFQTLQSDEERRARLAEVATMAEGLAAAGDLADAQRRWPVVEREWRKLHGAGPSAEVEARWEAALQRLRAREHEAREERAKKERETLAKWEKTCERLERALASELSLKDAEHALKDARPQTDQMGAFPTKADRDRVVERLKAVHDALLPKVQELRDLDEWKRWANAGVQEELCAQVEGLREATDLADAARQLREIRKAWSSVSSVPNAVSQALWQRFKLAADEVRAKCDAYFAQEGEARQEHLKAKVELCERAEALAESTDWIKTAEELQALQTKWKAVGAVPKDQSTALFARFRAACDRFFTRRKADLAERKEAWAANQTKKEALCAKAEELAESTEWASTAAALKALQAEWKTVGPVRKQKSEQLWKRFRAASDKFFDRYKNRDQFEMEARVSRRAGLCADMEALAASVSEGGEVDAASVRAQVQTLWTAWRQAPPIPREQVEGFQDRFDTALGKVVAAHPDLFKRTELDFEANRRRKEDLCGQVEALASGRRSPVELGAAPAATLATLLREALAANTIGGRVDADAQRRASREAAKELQDAWRRVGPVPGEDGRRLAGRFGAALRRVLPPESESSPRGEGGPRPGGGGRDRGGRPGGAVGPRRDARPPRQAPSNG